jgi:hypothetical protein
MFILRGKKVVRAIGQPGLDAVEILAIGDTFIQSVKSTSDYFSYQQAKTYQVTVLGLKKWLHKRFT